MRITNLNPDSDIGASAWFVELEGHRLLMDAGVHPKREGRSSLPLYDVVKNEELDAIAISHCHHDHVGSLPVALRYFPHAHVLMSELSYFLVERVLHNSVNVMTRQRDEAGVKEYPLFTHDEVDDIEPLFQGFGANREVDWASFRKTRAGLPSPTLRILRRRACARLGRLDGPRSKRKIVLHGRRLLSQPNNFESGSFSGCPGGCVGDGNHTWQSCGSAGVYPGK